MNPLETDTLPLTSVIVAAFNAQSTLSACLDSLLQLDYPADRLELICVDNASTDHTARILAQYGERIHTLHETQRGPAAARNCGIRQARGTVIGLTDADCVVDRAWLRHLVAPLADSSIGVVGGRILSRRPCNAIEAFGEQIHDHDRAMNVCAPPYAITMNWASRRDTLEQIGLFDESFLRSSDVDCAYRLVEAGFRLVYAADAIIYHRNERTPWGLMHEGYIHGFHYPHLAQRHGPLITRMLAQRAANGNSDRPPLHADRPAQHWTDPIWASLFQLGKRVGRRHGARVRR